MNSARPIGWAVSDGLTDYAYAAEVMARHALAIRNGEGGELVWLVEHPHVYTAGTSARPEHVKGTHPHPVLSTGRGGQMTYHGPGQRVAYVLIDLAARGGDVRAYVCALEKWIIRTLGEFNVKGEIRDGRVGVWVRRPDKADGHEDKIAAIGVRVSRGVTSHGVAINVEPDLSNYDGIIPCGITDHGVTSLVDLGLPVIMTDIDIALRRAFEREFGPTTSVAPLA